MRKRVIILIVLLVVVIGGWYGYKEYNRKNKDLTDVEATSTTDAASIIKAFATDSAAANKQYLGKIIAVTGTVKAVETTNGSTLVLGESGNTSSVRCSMDTTHLEELAPVKEGQTVTVKGACTGYNADELGIGADVILNRCVVQSSKK